jgi:hypothetical protein
LEGPWRAIGYGIFDGAEGKKAPIEPLETDDRCKRILLGTLGMKKDFASLEALCVTIGLLENAAGALFGSSPARAVIHWPLREAPYFNSGGTLP